MARCSGAAPVIVSATPAQGFQVERDSEGEGQVRVEFESDAQDLRVRVEITCVDGVPRESVEVEAVRLHEPVADQVEPEPGVAGVLRRGVEVDDRAHHDPPHLTELVDAFERGELGHLDRLVAEGR